MPICSAILVALATIAGAIGFAAPSATGIGLCLILLLLAGAAMDARIPIRGAHRLD